MGATKQDHRDRSLVLVAIGVLLLLVGAVAAFYGPLEMYCFYLFSEGGRFHYEGFRFGSFMFGNLACQIIGYYLIAAVLIPLGYGHVRVRRWARPLALTLLWAWLVVGVPLIIVFLFILFSAKDLSMGAAVVMLGLAGLSYFILPGVLIRFYQSRDVRSTFDARDPGPHWTDRLPTGILVLVSLFLFYAVALHVPIFFNGLFPLVGVWASGLQGILLLDLAILCLVLFAWGTWQRQIWAWWGAVAYFGFMTVSWVLTLARSSWMDLLLTMNLPPYEMEILRGVPLQGYHFAAFVGVPFLLTLGAVVRARHHFQTAGG